MLFEDRPLPSQGKKPTSINATVSDVFRSAPTVWTKRLEWLVAEIHERPHIKLILHKALKNKEIFSWEDTERIIEYVKKDETEPIPF